MLCRISNDHNYFEWYLLTSHGLTTLAPEKALAAAAKIVINTFTWFLVQTKEVTKWPWTLTLLTYWISLWFCVCFNLVRNSQAWKTLKLCKGAYRNCRCKPWNSVGKLLGRDRRQLGAAASALAKITTTLGRCGVRLAMLKRQEQQFSVFPFEAFWTNQSFTCVEIRLSQFRKTDKTFCLKPSPKLNMFN